MSQSRQRAGDLPHPFPGGLATTPDKAALARATIPVAMPPRLYLPLLGYRARALLPTVEAGDHVLAGQTIACAAARTDGPDADGGSAPTERLVASTSGRIVGIDTCAIASPVAAQHPCLVIDTDGEHRVQAGLDWRTAGIHGLGGAGYDLARKLAALPDDAAPTLLINAAECEPEIASDEALMQRNADTIVEGIVALQRHLGARPCRIGIESGKHQAIASLQQALAAATTATPSAEGIELVALPDRYPGGAESVLVRQLTGLWLPTGERAVQHGIVCINVATAHAIGAIIRGGFDGRRIVTIAGEGARQACTASAWLGTPLPEILKATGNDTRHALDKAKLQVWYGGAFSGFPLAGPDIVLTAELNCVLLRQQTAAATARPCIRCTLCAEVCPVALQPQQLYRYARSGDSEALQRERLERCIACGCCDQVCPSHLPLTASFRHARSLIALQADEAQRARQAVSRYTAHTARQEARTANREAAIAARKRALAAKPDAGDIQAALARARTRRKPADPT